MHGKTHTGFGTTAQFVRNVGIVIECCECNKWRVLYSKSKVEIATLERHLLSVWKAPEDEFDESERVSVNEIYYQYCDECYTTVSNKKKQISSSKRSRK
ncbi:unnamed protein product [Rhizophagus irregularis]|nr:unnamed protein product [Rhizophagus irregularis]